jgi:hypothetical protein
MEDRDNSNKAIMDRYDKANRTAIVTYNNIMFDSIRDIFYLMKRVEALESKCKVLTQELSYAKQTINERDATIIVSECSDK